MFGSRWIFMVRSILGGLAFVVFFGVGWLIGGLKGAIIAGLLGFVMISIIFQPKHFHATAKSRKLCTENDVKEKIQLDKEACDEAITRRIGFRSRGRHSR